MPKIACMSDIHTERLENSTRCSWSEHYPLDLGPSLQSVRAQHPDVLVLGGDIGRAMRGDNPASALSLDYARQAGQYLGCPVILVPGNHEYYGFDFDTARQAMLEESTPDVRVLDRGEAIMELDGVSMRFLGATMWTDYAVSGDVVKAMSCAEKYINDHKRIKRGRRMFTPADALREHRLSERWLMERLGEHHDGPSMIVSHHVPHSGMYNPQYEFNHLAAAFMGNMDAAIQAAESTGVKLWLYGHHHWCGLHSFNELTLASFQVGYEGENTGWTEPGILRIDA